MNKKTAPLKRSILIDHHELKQAIALIRLGARLPMLQAETDLPYDRLLKLYKELVGTSPSKGQLPSSIDWFLVWPNNIHASFFYGIYICLIKENHINGIDALLRAYKLYCEEISLNGPGPILSVTRSWYLVKFVSNRMLSTDRCAICQGFFISSTLYISDKYICGFCAAKVRRKKNSIYGKFH